MSIYLAAIERDCHVWYDKYMARSDIGYGMELSQVSPSGERYAPVGGLVDSSCRICNNERREEINLKLLDAVARVDRKMAGAIDDGIWFIGRKSIRKERDRVVPAISDSLLAEYSVTREDMERHLVRHLAPMCMEVLDVATGGSPYMEQELSEDGEELILGGRVAVPMASSEAACGRTVWRRDAISMVSEASEIQDEEGKDVVYSWNDTDDEMELPKLREIRRGRKEYDVGKGYSNPLRRWTEARMEKEVEKVTRSTVTFLDEMLNVRDMAHRIYREIMDNGDMKYYATAVSAIHEVRGVMESLAKLSLIAQRMEDGGANTVRKLSPAMRDMVRSMGITEELDHSEKDVIFVDTGLREKYVDDTTDTGTDASTIPDPEPVGVVTEETW